MATRISERGLPKSDRGRSSLVRGSLWVLALSLLGVGCGRSTAPVPREVQKPISPQSSSFDLPTQISYPDIPEVPDKIARPSPPIAGQAANTPAR